MANLREVKFCPWCGSNHVQRDDFNPAAINKKGEQRDHGLRAWVCNSCFQGYAVHLSPRAEYARHMIREQAKLRPSERDHRGYTEREWQEIVNGNMEKCEQFRKGQR